MAQLYCELKSAVDSENPADIARIICTPERMKECVEVILSAVSFWIRDSEARSTYALAMNLHMCTIIGLEQAKIFSRTVQEASNIQC